MAARPSECRARALTSRLCSESAASAAVTSVRAWSVLPRAAWIAAVIRLAEAEAMSVSGFSLVSAARSSAWSHQPASR
jgi:hypothetical protein